MFGVRTYLKTLDRQSYVPTIFPFGPGILTTSQSFRAFMEVRAPQIVRCGPSLVCTYLGLLPDRLVNAYWQQILNIVVSFPAGEALDWLDKFNSTNALRHLQPSQDFEGFFKDIIIGALEDGVGDLRKALSLLDLPGSYFFLSVSHHSPIRYTRHICDSRFPAIPPSFSFGIIRTTHPGDSMHPFCSVGSS